MKISNVHCLFEQSGTFKNQFINLGVNAYDYDIENQFSSTDFVLDLYKEIERAYYREKSIFDNFTKDDLLFAFFPCIRFESQILLAFRGDQSQLKTWSQYDKLLYDLSLQKELNTNYTVITWLVMVCLERGLRLIIENPYSSQHYLITHWSLKPALIDYNRRERGDYFEKPTAFWFVNCQPSNNFIFESQVINPKRTVDESSRGIARSLIAPEYANRFIREFIL